MTDKTQRDFKIELEKSETGTLIRITDVSQTNFDNAYRLATDLLDRATNLDSELHQLRLVEQAKNKVAMYWIQDGDTKRISDFISQRSHRIALSLLDVYPEGKIQSQIVKETNISQPTIHIQLSGKVKSVADYFEKRGNCYFLTKTGLDWILRDVIPFVSNSSSDR